LTSDYLSDLRFCDAQFHLTAKNVQGVVQRQGDAQIHAYRFRLDMDVSAYSRQHIHLDEPVVRLSIEDEVNLLDAVIVFAG